MKIVFAHSSAVRFVTPAVRVGHHCSGSATLFRYEQEKHSLTPSPVPRAKPDPYRDHPWHSSHHSAIGESIFEGLPTRWLVDDGSWVEEGEPLYELETDKVGSEVAAEVSGQVSIGVGEGQTVPVGGVMHLIPPLPHRLPLRKQRQRQQLPVLNQSHFRPRKQVMSSSVTRRLDRTASAQPPDA